MTVPTIDRPDRIFEVWSYSVSLGRLLLRSNKSDTFASRIDVLFQNVKAMSLATSLQGLVVTEATPAEAARLSERTGQVGDAETVFFVVRSGSYAGFVIAGMCMEFEDSGEFFEPSQLWPVTE